MKNINTKLGNVNDSLISIQAIGDVSFQGENADNPSSDIFHNVNFYNFESDITIANLENPLLLSGEPVPNKCTLRGSTGWANVLKESGISVVSLANNHTMDYGKRGITKTIKALEKAGIYYVGAGKNRNEANKALRLNINDQSLSIIGRTNVIVDSPCYATDTQPGVAFLDIDETKENIERCKEKNATVILCIHWGLEEYSYPTPNQRKLAREFIEAGANIILGHHPHVLQGVEKIGDGLVCYSLGNFLFSEFTWTFTNRDGRPQNKLVRLSEANRKGGLVKIDITRENSVSWRFSPTRIKRNGSVEIDDTPVRRKEHERLCFRLNWPAYTLLWKIYSLKCEWNLRVKPLFSGKLTWRKLKKMRFTHFKQLSHILRRTIRISSEKTTNPYE